MERTRRSIFHLLLETHSGRGLPITPLIDVVFLLLIFFIITMKFPTREKYLSMFLARVSGAESVPAEAIPPPYPIKLSVETGRLVIEGRYQRFDSFEQLGRDLVAFKGLARDLPPGAPETKAFSGVIIHYESDVKWGDLIAAIGTCKNAQIDNVAFRQLP